MTGSTMMASIDRQAIAAAAFGVLGTGRQLAPFSDRAPGFGLEDAYRVTAAIREMREARGETPIGRKIGFTNRTIWDEYKVSAPMWGYVYDRTVHDLVEIGETLPLAGFAEPQIEPEIVFGLSAAPAPEMDERQILGCVAWVAHGFEIVQSIFPGWRFALPDTVAAYGLHGALMIGPRHLIAADREAWWRTLSAFEIGIWRDGTEIDRGHAANVLDGPLSALRHLIALLARDGANPSLAAGEIVTTGTLTRAFPVAPGQSWRTEPRGIALDGIRIRFA
ncbi:MAG: 2-keto-4-pentenoate hydratase [Thermomicrobiales bacterium]